MARILSLFRMTLSITLCITLLCTAQKCPVQAAAPIILLSEYSKTMKIGDEFYLKAITSNLSKPSFKSSSSRIASVNSYGLITAKHAGTCWITVKAGTSETFCHITVTKTKISLNQSKLSLERGEAFSLKAKTSNGSKPIFRCNKKSIVLITDSGQITALKPGEAVITVKADQTEVYCYVTVRKPLITLNKTSHRMYRGQSFQLSASVSSGIAPVWKTNKKSVATVTENGKVIAVKHGTAAITAKIDGVSKSCMITVCSPAITLSCKECRVKVGKKKKLTAKVSSGNKPVWSSSKSSVAVVDQSGNVTAKKKGTALIRVKEDGTTALCVVQVVSF